MIFQTLNLIFSQLSVLSVSIIKKTQTFSDNACNRIHNFTHLVVEIFTRTAYEFDLYHLSPKSHSINTL